MDTQAEIDNFLAKLCLFREARGESVAGKAAVLSVIRNRAEDPKNRWPKTIGDVIQQPYQFSSFNASDPNVTLWPSQRRQGDWQAWLDCVNVVDTPLAADPTSGANFYCVTSIISDRVAKEWLGPEANEISLMAFKTVELGAQTFFRIP